MKIQKVVHSETQNHQEHEEHASTHDINELSIKYICMNLSSNKGIYKVNVKKNTLCSFKTMNIKVL